MAVTGEQAFHPSLRSAFFNKILVKVNNGQWDKEDLRQLLKSNEASFIELSLLARYVRLVNFGGMVKVRGVIEISNNCHNSCNYCGMRVQNKDLPRYRLQAETIIAIAKQIRQSGIKTVFLQSGDDEGFKAEELCQIISEIKKQTEAEVLLCLGERKIEDYSAFHDAGADSAIIKHETSDAGLFGLIKPGGKMGERQGLLKALKEIGYRIGSGVIIFPLYSELCNMLSIGELISEGKNRAKLIEIGIENALQKCIVPLIRIRDRTKDNMGKVEEYVSSLPEIMPALLCLRYNQYMDSLVNDILLMKEMGVDMASAAPFIPNEQSPMLNWPAGSLDLTLRFMVACRLILPDALIPSVSALGRVEGWRKERPGIYDGLMAGANVVTVNFTPPNVREGYAIYSGNRADEYIVSFEKAMSAIEKAGLKPDLSMT